MKKINLLLAIAIFSSLFVGTYRGAAADTCTTSITIDQAQVIGGGGIIAPPPLGTADLTYDTVSNQLDYSVRWRDLTGPPTNAHFHGNAPSTGTAGVKLAITLPVTPMATDITTGTGTVLDADEAALLTDAMWYINIHTDANPGGEIRGNVVDFTCVPPPCPADLLINELDADQVSTDSMEFVELYDGGAGNTALDGCRVIFFNGSTDTAYKAFDLAGFMTDADGFFVLGNPGVANVDLVFEPGGSGALQNGADAVAIYNSTTITVSSAVTTTNLISALVYDTGDSDAVGLLTGLGETTQYDEDENGNKDTESIQRNSGSRDNGQSYFVTLPTPGSVNSLPTAIGLDANNVAIGLTSGVLLLGLIGLTGLTLVTKRRRQ